MIKKLQSAINGRGGRLLYQTSQFYSDSQDRPVTIYYIKEARDVPGQKKKKNVELFHSASQVQIVLFLRDYWYQMTGQELPTDNVMWNGIRERIQKGEFNHG